MWEAKGAWSLAPRSSAPSPFLFQLALNERQHQIDKLFHPGREVLLDRGEILRLRFAVVAPVRAAASAPAACVKRIDQCRCANEIEGVDHPLLIDFALPELVQAVFTFEDRNGFIDIHQCPFFATESALGGFVLEALDKRFHLVRPFHGFLS